MDPEITSRFHNGLLQQAMERYAIAVRIYPEAGWI
jgi:hypothetical protein